MSFKNAVDFANVHIKGRHKLHHCFLRSSLVWRDSNFFQSLLSHFLTPLFTIYYSLLSLSSFILQCFCTLRIFFFLKSSFFSSSCRAFPRAIFNDGAAAHIIELSTLFFFNEIFASRSLSPRSPLPVSNLNSWPLKGFSFYLCTYMNNINGHYSNTKNTNIKCIIDKINKGEWDNQVS